MKIYLKNLPGIYDFRSRIKRAPDEHTNTIPTPLPPHSHTVCLPSCRFFPLRYDTWSVEPLRFNRCACLVAPELDKLEAEHEVRSGLEQQGSGVFIATTGKDSGGGGSRHDKRNELRAPVGAAGSLPFSLELHEESSDRRGRIEVEGEEAMKKKHNNDEGRVMIASGVCFPCRALSVENEQAVLTEIILLLLEARDAFPTTLEHDEAGLQQTPTVKYRSSCVARFTLHTCMCSV